MCRCSDCVVLAKKKKALSRALRTEVSEDVYDSLLALCAGEDGEA